MNGIILQDMREIEQRGQEWGWLHRKTVLITGAYGMLAAYIVFFLIYLNETHPHMLIEIMAQGRNAEKMRLRFGSYMDKEYFHAIYDDICQPLRLDE